MTVTERQQKWFDTIREGLQAETGKTLAQWVEIAKTCPETKHRAKLNWFKTVHGLGQNRASIVLDAAEPKAMGWSEPEALLDVLWSDPASRAIYDAVAAQVKALPEIVIGPRKAFVGLSRKFQFAAVRPLKGGGAVLGLDVAPDADPRLQPVKRESWSERLKATLTLDSPAAVDSQVAALLRQAWERAA
jgi:hypothetical protein